MKKALQVAKNELYSLFYSPIAYVMMVIFVVMSSSAYFLMLTSNVERYEEGGAARQYVQKLTFEILTARGYGLFNNIIQNLYIFLPLITMGLISRERSSGTIRLLYSSPIKIREFVLGKYLAMMCYVLAFMVLTSLFLISLALCIDYPDYSQMLASFFGLFLVLMTYAAIGLFVSSLTVYQIVAATITLVFFGFLNTVGDLWQDNAAIRDISFYMNLSGKAGHLIKGLLNIRDVVYFLILIAGFLSFTIIKIKSATQSISAWKKALRYACVIAIAIPLAYLSNNPWLNAYWDSTRGEMQTITKPTQARVAEMDEGPLQVTAYCNIFDNNFGILAPRLKNATEERLWEPYIRFKPDIHINYIFYYALDTNSEAYKTNRGKTTEEILAKMAEFYSLDPKQFLSEQEVSKQVDVKKENLASFFVLKYKDKSTILRTFWDSYYLPVEDEIAAAFNRMLHKQIKVDFLSDEIERGPFSLRDRDYTVYTYLLGDRESLVNQGYDVDTISLRDSAAIPEDLAELVIADPRKPFSKESLNKIYKYIDDGGNLLITAEPDRTEVVKPLLEKLGVQIHPGLLIQPSHQYESDLVLADQTDSSKQMSPQTVRYAEEQMKYYGDSLLPVAMEGVSALDYVEKDGFRICPLLRTDKTKSWNRISPIDPDSLQLPINELPNDEPGSFVTTIKMNRMIRGKEQRIIVSGDADYLTSGAFRGREPRRHNGIFGPWNFFYYSYGKFPANTLRAESLDSSTRISSDDIPYLETLFYWIIPTIIGILATIFLVRRKRK